MFLTLVNKYQTMAEPTEHVCTACGATFPDEESLVGHFRTVGLAN